MHLQFFAVHGWLRPALYVIGSVTAASLAGCSMSAPKIDSGGGLTCVDDTPTCIKRRGRALNALTADKSRAWVTQPASARAYASGVRLFALRKVKSALTCKELALARRETAGAKAALRAPSAALTPAQISRAIILAGEVGRDLAREFKRRCKRG